MRRPFLLLVLLLVLALTACAGDPPTDRSADPKRPLPIPEATTAPPAPASGPLGLKWSRFQPATLDFVRRTAGGWTFTEVEWCEVERTAGVRDWQALDQIVQTSLDLGHEPMIKLRTGQCWATRPPVNGEVDPTEAFAKTPSTMPIDLDAYLGFVTELVQRYAALGVHVYAVENEVDVANFWAAGLAEYDHLVRQVAPAVREADPEAEVLDAGVSSTSYGVAMAAQQLAAGDGDGAFATYQLYYGRRIQNGVSRWPRVTSVDDLRLLLEGEAARRSIEAVELALRLATEGVVDAYQLHFYESVEALPELLDFLAERLAGAVPIEAWEAGVAWPGDEFDERTQAEEVYQLVALLLAHGAYRIVYLPVAYTPGDRTQVFRGLVHEDGTSLLAGHAWVGMSDALIGLDEASVTALDGDLTGVAWSAGGRDAAIVWATSEPTGLPQDSTARVLDAAGAEVDRDQPVGSAPVLVLGSVGEDLLGGLVSNDG